MAILWPALVGGRISTPPAFPTVRHSLSPRGTSGESTGERGSFLRSRRCLAAPLPYPLPTPSSWGEGILWLRWWSCQDAPPFRLFGSRPHLTVPNPNPFVAGQFLQTH